MASAGFNGFSDVSDDIYAEHIVLKNESLWSIAKRYLGNGGKYSEIKEFNNLESDTIYEGQILRIPL